MKKITCLVILLLGLLSGCAKEPGYLFYPTYQKVYTAFLNKYSLTDVPDISLLQFQKKPDGWHVVVFKGPSMQIEKDELFWSSSKKTFQNIKFNEVSSPEENRQYFRHFQNDPMVDNFNLLPYYNYPGCDWDVIQEYKDYKNLPDSVLYALGRCYSYFADNLLSKASGFSDTRFRFNLKEGLNCLSPEQLEKYRLYHNLAISTFKQVQKLNPRFETIIGDIGVKLSDEYMVGYFDMLLYQNEEEANKEIKDCTYDSFMVSLAKDYLSSCDSNAILITDGDNDTYPLLYVQAKYKYRTDVLVLNAELFGLSRYIDRLRLPYMQAHPVELSFTSDQYHDGTRDFLYYYNGKETPGPSNSYWDLNRVMKFIVSANPLDKIVLSDGENANYLPTKMFELPVNKENVIKSKILPAEKINSMPNEIKWTINDNFIYKNKMVLLNALAVNDWKRPICFSSGCPGDICLGLDHYLRLQGLAYEVIPISSQSPDSSSKNGPPVAISDDPSSLIYTSTMYNTVMHKFEWGNISSGIYLDEQKISMTNSLRYAISNLASKLIAENKKDLALNVLNLCMDSIPGKNCPYNYYVVDIDRCYYDLGNMDKANAISKELFKNNEELLIKYTQTEAARSYYSDLIAQSLAMLEKLIYYTTSYNQNALHKEYVNRVVALSKKGALGIDDITSLGITHDDIDNATN